MQPVPMEFRTIGAAFPEPILLISPDGRIRDLNQGAADWFGDRSVEEKALSDYLFESPTELAEYLEEASKAPRPLARALTFKSNTGQRVLCQATASLLGGTGLILLRLLPSVARFLPNQLLPTSEDRLRLALEAGRMAIWDWDPDTDQIAWGASVRALPGLEGIQLPGTLAEYQKVVHPEDRGLVLRSLEETLSDGQDHQVECRLVDSGGNVHWIEERAKPVLDDRGAVSRVVGLCIDIDHRKRLEGELRQRVHELAEAEQRSRSVMDHVLDAVITINQRGLIQSVNPAAERLFGYAADDLLGQNVKILMPEPHHGRHDNYLANYLRTGQAKIIGIGREVVGKRRDGTTFPMHLGVSEFWLEGQRYFTGIVHDITAQKQAEATARFLADVSRALATVVDYPQTVQKIGRLAVPFLADVALVHLADENRRLSLAASAAESSCVSLEASLAEGLSLDTTSAAGPGSVYRTGMTETIETVDRKSLSSLVPAEEQAKRVSESGLSSYTCVPLIAGDHPLGALTLTSRTPRRYQPAEVSVAEDFGRRASVALENARLYAQLREADRRKDEFLAMLAHELRNPLAPIRAGLDLLALTGVERENVAVMQRQLDHLVRLVDDLLDVSRIMRGQITLQQEVMDLGAIVQQAADAVRPAIQFRQQILAVSLPVDPVYVRADPVRITQAVTNLLTNAAKYTPSGGQIRLAIARENDQVSIFVRDTGIGINRELLPRIFELFTQGDRSLERSRGGLGIGLTIVRNLVEMHGGSVSAASAGEGKGSEFTIRLPVPAKLERPRPPEAQPEAGPPRRILIVEDNPGTAKLLAKLLAKLGHHELFSAADGLQAIDVARGQHPEIILLDIGLPLLNGYDVASRLRADPRFRETLIVAVTGYGTEEDRQRSRNSGFDKHLVKPVSLAALREVLSDPKLAAERPQQTE